MSYVEGGRAVHVKPEHWGRYNCLAKRIGQIVMTYRLYFGDFLVGGVTDADADGLSVCGQLETATRTAAPPTPEAVRIGEFIRLTQECLRLTDNADDPLSADVAEELHEKNGQLAAYFDLTDSPKWHVADDAGERRPILCPLFRDGGEIIWRWSDA